MSETEKTVAEEVSFRARALELELRERVDNNTAQRLDSLANFVGIMAAVVFGVFGLGTYLLVQNIVQGAIEEGTPFDARINARFERLNVSLNATIATEVEEIAMELAQALDDLRAERSLSTLLPLVVGEAIELSNFDDDSIYDVSNHREYSEQLVISAMGQIAPAVEDLDGFAFDLAARRIERILDTFWSEGRHHELHQTFNTMSPELQVRLLSHENEGILFTMADGLTTELMETARLPPARDLVLDRVLRQSPDPTGDAAMAVATLRLFMLTQDQGWDSPQIAARLNIDAETWPEMVPSIYQNLVCFLVEDFPDDPQLLDARESDLLDRLTMFSDLISEESLFEICETMIDEG